MQKPSLRSCGSITNSDQKIKKTKTGSGDSRLVCPEPKGLSSRVQPDGVIGRKIRSFSPALSP
jgi:hypothetical protein